MKVLFALNDENVSEEIVKKYQKDYKEIISYKNVYYFNAIIKEMQRDKSYDRIVIGEDLEPFANNNYDTIDKFLFEKLDSISDESTDNGEKEAQIILICSDRRTKSDALLVKLFGIGVYSAIVGKDRSIEEVCRLINNPRTKKEAKQYYRIDSDDVNYKAENDTDVNENEIQSILKHYKSLGKNEEKYVESFNNIASQYTDAQLRVIIKFLPLNVKAVLEEKSPKYQQVVMFGEQQYKKKNTSNIIKQMPREQSNGRKKDRVASENGLKIDSIERHVNNPLTGKSIIIPGTVNSERNIEAERELQTTNNQTEREFQTTNNQAEEKTEQNIEDEIDNILNMAVPTEVKRGRGRPKKIIQETDTENEIESVKRGRGRPKKIAQDTYEEFEEIKVPSNEQESVVLPGLDEDAQAEPSVLPGLDNEEVILPGIESVEETNTQNYLNNQPQDYDVQDFSNYNNYENEQNREIQSARPYYNTYEPSNLVVGDKKVVAFVGSTKNGTSFIVNNLAILLSSMGINTAVLDLTENKNAYFIYTKNEEELRKIAYNSISKLKSGESSGIRVNKNLNVYTSLPGESEERNDIQSIIKTLTNNHNLILLDCDFNTPMEYFANAQEIYLVQSMDVLTIQPLTAFMRDLKNNGILNQEKLRIIINKHTKIRGLNEKVLIGGMAFYNSPSMSFMTELFNKENVKYCTIPLDTNTYIAYLEAMVSCDISLNRYSKAFMQALKELAKMVYPLLNRQDYKTKEYKQDNSNTTENRYFSSDINNTLEQMNRMKNGF